MKLNLTDQNVGNIFQVEGDSRYFKCVETGINSIKTKTFRFYVYAFQENSQTWRLDYTQAMRLAEVQKIHVHYSKIMHIVPDVMLFSGFARTEFKNKYDLFVREGKRYVAEARIEYKDDYSATKEIIRTSSAAIDNIAPMVMTYAPEVACKRAVIKCIIDALHLEDIVEEFYQYEDEEGTKKKQRATPRKTEMVTNLQLEQLKILDPKFTEKKYKDKTLKQAGEIIDKLNKTKKTTKKIKKK